VRRLAVGSQFSHVPQHGHPPAFAG
jgi:hypothetical protein